MESMLKRIVRIALVLLPLGAAGAAIALNSDLPPTSGTPPPPSGLPAARGVGHREVGGGDKVDAWVVYPERADRAPVVLVVHEIFGLTDWARAVADQLAAEGFLAVAPDFLSGKGPGGKGSSSLSAKRPGS